MVNVISFPNLGLSFKINRAAFTVGGINIYWYGIILACGMIAGLLYAFREAKKQDIKQDDALNMFLIAVPVAIICARLYYVIFSFDMYRDNLLEIFDIRGGGIAVYGSFIGAAAVVIIYCLKKKISLGKVLDILAVGFLIGQAIGRWGNFVNGEAYGGPCSMPWAMTVAPTDGSAAAESVHPTFLYESLWDALGVLLLLLYKRRKKFDGEVFCLYILWYGIGRFWIEGMRTDSLYLGTIRISQLVALISAIAAAAAIIIIRKKSKSKE